MTRKIDSPVVDFLKKAYMIYGLSMFGLLFLLFFIPLLVPIAFPRLHRLAAALNRWWARTFFFAIAMPYKVEYRAQLDRRKKYIFCANHFSWIDIPTVGLNRIDTVFVGKSEIASTPVFGWMYRRLHITIDRNKPASLRAMMSKVGQALDEGKSVCVFPEGGMRSKNPPVMESFKDGAFRAAIARGVPVTPITIVNNWIIFPSGYWRLTHGLVKVIFHEPIDVAGLALDDADVLKRQVYHAIEEELCKAHPHAMAALAEHSPADAAPGVRR